MAAVFNRSKVGSSHTPVVGYNYKLTTRAGKIGYVMLQPDMVGANFAKRILNSPWIKKHVAAGRPVVKEQKVLAEGVLEAAEKEFRAHLLSENGSEAPSESSMKAKSQKVMGELKAKLVESGELENFLKAGTKLLAFMQEKDMELKVNYGGPFVYVFPLPETLPEGQEVETIFMLQQIYMSTVVERSKMHSIDISEELVRGGLVDEYESLLPPVSIEESGRALNENALGKMDVAESVKFFSMMADSDYYANLITAMEETGKTFMKGDLSPLQVDMYMKRTKLLRSDKRMKRIAVNIHRRIAVGDSPLIILPFGSFGGSPQVQELLQAQGVTIERDVPKVNGFLYEVKGPDGGVAGHLYGTIHSCTKSMAELSPEIKIRLNEASAVYGEYNPFSHEAIEKSIMSPKPNLDHLIQEFQKQSSDRKKEIINFLKTDLSAVFSGSQLKDLEKELALVESLTDQFVLLVNARSKYQEKQIGEQIAIDIDLLGLSLKRGKKVGGLRSVDSEMETVEKLALATSLEDVLAPVEAQISKLSAMREAWAAGDLEPLEDLITPTTEDEGFAHDLLFSKRDIAMSESINRIAQEQEEGKKSFFMVGAGHIKGIQRELAKKGYTLTRTNPKFHLG